MTKLSVNINKIATLRNARGEDNPNVLEMALKIESYGAHGITVHPRPDERHITRKDVFTLKPQLTKEFNCEGYPSEDFLAMMEEINPEQVTLVPDPPDVLTSNAGWNIEKNQNFLIETIDRIHQNTDARVSIFLDPGDYWNKELTPLQETKVDRIELYTYAFAKAFGTPEAESVTKIYAKTAEKAHALGIGINAGHDLDSKNLKYFLSQVPHIAEVSIGHALVCEALEFGMKETIEKYMSLL